MILEALAVCKNQIFFVAHQLKVLYLKTTVFGLLLVALLSGSILLICHSQLNLGKSNKKANLKMDHNSCNVVKFLPLH